MNQSHAVRASVNLRFGPLRQVNAYSGRSDGLPLRQVNAHSGRSDGLS